MDRPPLAYQVPPDSSYREETLESTSNMYSHSAELVPIHDRSLYTALKPSTSFQCIYWVGVFRGCRLVHSDHKRSLHTTCAALRSFGCKTFVFRRSEQDPFQPLLQVV